LDSFRTPTFRRWPQTGMPQPFADWAEYEDLVAALVDAGAISDGTNLYWDLRPSWRFDTVEVRIADMCTTVDEAVTLAGLTRALVWRILAPDQVPAPARTPRTEVLEAAVRRAPRYGLSEQLLHPVNASLAPAGQVVDALLAHCAPGLDALGDADLVAAGIDRIRTRGNSATRQRAAYARRGRWEDVVDALADETVAAL
ncbi:MAG: carboxylate-amine ligase, partial [Acidimicrobiales bacterium]